MNRTPLIVITFASIALTACPKDPPPSDPVPADCKGGSACVDQPAPEGPPPIGSQAPGPETR